MATLAAPPRAIAPFDVSDVALFVDDTWREPFAKLRAEMPVSWCADSPYGGYWSVVTHELVAQVELDPATYSSSWENGNIVIADPKPESILALFEAASPEAAPPQMSAMDKGALRGLYVQKNNNVSAAVQRGRIAKSMKEGAGGKDD